MLYADDTEVIRHKPDLAEAYYNRGHIYWIKGDLDMAIADYTVAMVLDSVRARRPKCTHDRRVDAAQLQFSRHPMTRRRMKNERVSFPYLDADRRAAK